MAVVSVVAVLIAAPGAGTATAASPRPPYGVMAAHGGAATATEEHLRSPVIVTAKSCARADVQRALNTAKDGSIVQIPAGTCNWGAAPAVTRRSGVWLRGAGKGATVIKRTAPVIPLPYDGKPCTADLSLDADGHAAIRDCKGNPPASQFLIDFDCANRKQVEISDLTLVGNDAEQTELQRLIDEDNGLVLRNGCTDFTVHDAAFNRFSDAGLSIRDGGRGVVYRSDFLSNFKCQDENTVLPRGNGKRWPVAGPLACLGYGIAIYGANTWAKTAKLGTANAVFVEDNNFFDNRHSVASNYGSNFVVRHNTIAHSERARDFGIVDAHGAGEYGIGSRSWEVYRNTLVDRTTTQWNTTGILMRGGDGVVWGNTVPSTFAAALGVTTETDCSAAAYPLPGQTRHAYVWGNHAPQSRGLVKPTLGYVIYERACVKAGRDVFASAMPGYRPYVYPHPLRSKTLF